MGTRWSKTCILIINACHFVPHTYQIHSAARETSASLATKQKILHLIEMCSLKTVWHAIAFNSEAKNYTKIKSAACARRHILDNSSESVVERGFQSRWLMWAEKQKLFRLILQTTISCKLEFCYRYFRPIKERSRYKLLIRNFQNRIVLVWLYSLHIHYILFETMHDFAERFD